MKRNATARDWAALHGGVPKSIPCPLCGREPMKEKTVKKKKKAVTNKAPVAKRKAGAR